MPYLLDPLDGNPVLMYLKDTAHVIIEIFSDWKSSLNASKSYGILVGEIHSTIFNKYFLVKDWYVFNE